MTAGVASSGAPSELAVARQFFGAGAEGRVRVRLIELLPDAADLLRLEPEELGGVLLRYLSSYYRGGKSFKRGNLFNPNDNTLLGGIPITSLFKPVLGGPFNSIQLARTREFSHTRPAKSGTRLGNNNGPRLSPCQFTRRPGRVPPRRVFAKRGASSALAGARVSYIPPR